MKFHLLERSKSSANSMPSDAIIADKHWNGAHRLHDFKSWPSAATEVSVYTCDDINSCI